MNSSLSNIRKEFLNYFIKNNHTHIKSSSLIPHNDNSLLFTNAGMVQFKNVFLGLEQKDYKRAVSVQKCLRAGGKHNDLDNVGYTARHQTLFEMLGNFSFGDYFKEEAIFYAYEFITKVLGIDKRKLLVTVYSEDQEAYELWQKIAGFSNDKIIKIHTSDNFWSMGDTGPSGPCTEIFYDLGESVAGGPPGTTNADGDRFTEIWNLVFMQYNQLGEGKSEILKTPAVDTGMGLERISAVMQGVLDNYDTDLFKTIIGTIQDLLQVKITPKNKASFKVIADHMRASAFLISDGVLPSNEGRGYVLRRIIRRAIRHGYLLGNKEPVLYKLMPLITDLMNSTYNELTCSLHLANTTIYSEEEKFNKTIEEGMKLLIQSKELVKNNLLPGDIAFKLYDTYGFPLDLTESILKQDNISVDINQFNEHMNNQKELSKKNWIGSGEIKDNEFWFKLNESLNTEFIGYDKLNFITTPMEIVDTSYNLKDRISTGDEAYLLFSETPFYPEGGGQVGDKGIIASYGSEVNLEYFEKSGLKELWSFYNKIKKDNNDSQIQSNNEIDINDYDNDSNLFKELKTKIVNLIEVLDTVKVAKDLIIHKVKVLHGELTKSDKSVLIVNPELRKRCAANHTATHILYTVLEKIFGHEVMQQGSLVSPNRLRADVFLNNPLTKEQIITVEKEATRIILSNLPIDIKFMSYKKAVDSGVSFLMGENYPDTVRVVSIGTDNRYISKELCCGCHVKNTGEIGLFKIVSESGIRCGVRRIEIVTGQGALQAFQSLENDINDIYFNLKANKNNVLIKINNLLTENKEINKKLDNLEILSLLNEVERNIQKLKDINYIKLSVQSNAFTKIRNIVTSIVSKYKPVIFFVTSENKEIMSFLLAISSDLSNKINLKNIMQELKLQADAKGGGNQLCIQGNLSIKNKTLLDSIIKSIVSK